MVNPIPEITVKSEIKRIINTNPHIRDVICLIGGFEKEIDEPKFYTNIVDAETDLGNDTTIEANAALKQIFRKNISGVLVVDITTHTGSGDSINYSRNVTKTKLESALVSVQDIEFDLLNVATELTDELITVIDTEAQTRFRNKKPFGYVGVVNRANESAYTTTASKLGDYAYAILTQALEVNNTMLSLVESGAYLCNLIATTKVGNSLTAKELTEVTGLGTSYTFEKAENGSPIGMGAKLVGMGYFVVRLINPLENIYECVNSAGANGLDLYINRVRDYIVNDFALRLYLGELNNKPTRSGVELTCSGLLTKFRNDMGVVEDINYAVEKVDSKTLNAILNSIQFADVITKINLFITIEVI